MERDKTLEAISCSLWLPRVFKQAETLGPAGPAELVCSGSLQITVAVVRKRIKIPPNVLVKKCYWLMENYRQCHRK